MSSLPKSLPPGIPCKIDNFEVQSFLGNGAYGYGLEVFDTQDRSRPLFLKWVKPDALANADRRTKNEIWAIKKTSAEQFFVSYVADGIYDGRPYYVSTLARGTTLRKIQEQHLREHGTPVGPRYVCLIGSKILEAICHLSALNIFHRDLKDDNITATESGNDITIIDFGCCKAEDTPEKNMTWLNPGATRFSPPSRDDRPAEVHPTHDIYSVGVLLYYLLSGIHPFDVAQHEGPVELTIRKKTKRPMPLWQINSHVDDRLSQFVDDLLTPKDEDRFTPEEALRRLSEIKSGLDESLGSRPRNRPGKIRLPEVVRDPLHGDIRLTETEYKIIHTAEFINLRKIKQLGFASIPFPGAEHTRYLHSLGALAVTNKVLDAIEDTTGRTFSVDDRLLARAYALLHDINHIPYGHTLEDELGLFPRHDMHKTRVARSVLNENTEIGKLLFAPEISRVRDFFQRDLTLFRLEGIRELLESVVGADVLDYIDRDSFFCGLDHRVDSAIFRRFRLRTVGAGDAAKGQFYLSLYGTSGVRLDAEFASESIFMSRYSLYLKVYTHPRKIAAGAMLGKAIWEHTAGRDTLHQIDERLQQMGDAEVLIWLKNSNRKATEKLANMLMREELYIPIYRCALLDKGNWAHDAYTNRRDDLEGKQVFSASGRDKLEKDWAKEAKVDADKIIIYCPKFAPGYNKLKQWVEVDKDKFEEYNESHSMHRRIRERHLGLWMAYVFCDPSLDKDQQARVAERAYHFFGITNQITVHRHQGLLL